MKDTSREKPKAKLIGQDGNVFNLLGICVKALRRAGMRSEATSLTNAVFSAKSYEEALCIMGEYCDIH